MSVIILLEKINDIFEYRLQIKPNFIPRSDPYKLSSLLAVCLTLIASNLILVVFRGPSIPSQLFENLFA